MSNIAAAMGQLPRFDGRSPDPKVWISQATRALRCFLASIPEEQQLDYLLMHLTDSAYVWAESKDFQSVAGFDKAFKERFIWESTANVMQRLTALKQKPGQTVTELADEVRQLAAYVPNYPTAMAVRHFIEGLGDKGLRERVLGGRPISLEAAEEAAKYFVSYSLPMGIEPVVEAAKEKDPVNKESEVDKITKQLEKLSIQLAQMQQGRGGGLLPRPAGGGFKCYQCGKEGHMARDCTQKGRAALNVMQQVLEGKAPTIAEFLNGEEGKLDMLVGPRKRQAVRDPEGWGIDEAREELRKKLAETGGAEEAAKGSRFVRRPRVSALPNSYNVVDQLKLTPVSASVWNYISDSDKVRKELLDALKLAEDKGKEDGAAAMQGVSIVAAAPRESRHEDPIPSNLVFQVPQCDVHLGKHRLTAIVDSGASQTALSHVIARKLGLLPYLQDTTIEYTTSSGETSKPWGILPDVPVRVGKLTLPIDIAVTGANTYDMLLGQDWIYSANADILTSKGQIVYRVNTKETDSVPITTGPVGTGSRPSYVSLPPQTPRRKDPTPPQHWSGMNEEEFQRWLEEKQLLLAKEQGRIRLTEEEEADYWAWVQEEEELERTELEHEFYEELGTGGLNGIPEGSEPGGEVETDDEMPSLFGSDGERYSDLGASDDEAGEPHWDMGYEEARKAVEAKGEITDLWEGDSMTDGEEYLAPRVACPAFEDLPVSLNHELGMAQQTDLRKLLVEYREVFVTEAEPLGTHPTVFHHIATGSAKPISHKPYRVSPSERARIEEEVAALLEQGVIRPSNSPWASPCIVIPKKDFGDRVVIDYRPLNAVTEAADQFPMPRIDDILDRMTGSLYFSVLDVKSAYHTIRVAEEDIPKTAFVTSSGQYEYVRMPFGLRNAPATFQRLMTTVFRTHPNAIPYLDDIIVFSNSWEEHLEHLRDVFERVKSNHLLLKPNKCELGFYSTIYLGHIVTRDGVKPDAGKVEAISMMAAPEDVRGVREFLGCTSYYRRFIKGYAKVAHSLTQLLHKDNPFEWTDECERAFNALKLALISPPILAFPDFSKPFILQTDFSATALGAILAQKDEKGAERVVAYASRTTRGAEKNLSSTHGECLAVVWAIKHFRPYLYGSRFLLQTDHQALQWLMTAKDLTGKLARWSLLLQEYDFTVSYRPGETHRNVDALSRMHQVLHQQSGGEALSYAHSPPLSPTSNPIPMFTNLFPRSLPPPPAGEGSSSSVDGEGDGGDSGEEEGDEVDGREPEELSSNTEKRDGEEEGEVGQAGSEESDDGGGDEGSGEEDDETDGSGEEDGEDGEEEEEEEEEEKAAEGDKEIVAPGVGGQENDHEGSEERGSSPPMTRPLKKVRRDKGKSKEEAGTSKGDEKKAGGGGPPHGTQGEEQPGKSLASETTTLDIWDDLNTLFYLECGEVDPVWDTAEKRRVRARGKKFELRDGVLWNLKAKGDKKPVPRKEEREEIISLLHGLGHLGVQRTTDLVRKQYDWYGMGSDVSAFVRGCPTCTFQRGSWTAKGELRPVPVTKPWDRVVIDFVGPLPVTEKGGNRYIISAMDHFTKWPECKAVRHADSATAAAFVAEKIISTHGCPLVIHTDNGQHFHGEFGVLLEKFGIYHEFSRPNHPQSSGLIERFQRTLKGALMRLGETNPFEWDENICWVLLGYRASIHSSTKFSPFFLLYGRHPNITGSTLTEWEVKELTELTTEEEADAAAGLIYERSSEMELALAKAAENHDKAQEKQKVDFDRRRTLLEPIR
ncbi:unnamed protein product, partial [Closterium sp. NIES-54]